MKLNHEGLSLWYGTPDAPAPLDAVVARDGASLVAGVHPANPTNALNVRYRVDGGIVQMAAGRQLHTDYAKNSQYFTVPFPAFPVGDVVEYCPIFSCGGRQVPSPARADRFPSKFRLAPKQAPRVAPVASRPDGPRQRLTPELKFLAAITVRVDRQFVGETPEGVRINFYARDGTVAGPEFNGKVLPGSNDHMIVRTDGVGVIRVRAALASHDGALFEIDEMGSIDFGPDSYQRACANDLRSRSSLVVAPRILTGHPKYLWLNRSQCLGVGRTDLDHDTVEYDLFAVSSRPLDPKS